jgi:hypothetical protein
VDDAIRIEGLSVLLDDDIQPPYLELGLGCGGQTFQAAILAAEEDWAVIVRDENGRPCVGDGELYATQAGAILAALLTALETSRNPALQIS